MNNQASEAVIVAVLAFVLLFGVEVIWIGRDSRRPLRFSVRNLLVLTTLIAVVLGVLAYAARN